MNVASPRSVTRRKGHVTHNLDTSCMLRGSGLIGCDYKMMQSDAYERDEIEGVPASPYIVREAGLQVGSGREY
jgi:hypothetical protein